MQLATTNLSLFETGIKALITKQKQQGGNFSQFETEVTKNISTYFGNMNNWFKDYNKDIQNWQQ